MHRALAALLALAILPAAPAVAQPYESSLRFGLGLDYGGLVGRGDGGAGGLRLQLGARVHEHVAIYWQGQALGGAFVEPDRVLGVFRGWNAAMVEASYGIFQIAAGPSFDASVTCGVATGQGGGLAGCDALVAPGLATRAGLRFGILALSGDLHVTFDEHLGPDVWVLAGLGIQLGDVARDPMEFPSTDPLDRAAPPEPIEALEERPPFEAIQRPRVARTGAPPAGRLGRWLGDPRDPFGTDADWAAAPPEPAPVEDLVPARAPEMRRFSPGDVRTTPRAPAPARPAAEPSTVPELDDQLDAEASDDPIDGLEGY